MKYLFIRMEQWFEDHAPTWMLNFYNYGILNNRYLTFHIFLSAVLCKSLIILDIRSTVIFLINFAVAVLLEILEFHLELRGNPKEIYTTEERYKYDTIADILCMVIISLFII